MGLRAAHKSLDWQIWNQKMEHRFNSDLFNSTKFTTREWKKLTLTCSQKQGPVPKLILFAENGK